MKNYYENTTQIINKYNETINQIEHGSFETSERQDEFLQNFCIYLAHALIKDHGFGSHSREELCKVADIIRDVVV